MKSRSIRDYVSFGSALRFLEDAKPNFDVRGSGWVLRNIDRSLHFLNEFDLPVTRRASSDLVHLRNRLEKSSQEKLGTEASKLSDIITDLRKTLWAEAAGNFAFIVTDKRIDVNKLLSDVPGLLAPNVFGLLPDIAKHDFMEAGKCIAFELPTAAAFHILRGTEAVLRRLYCSIVRKNRVEFLWGPMITSLRGCSRPPSAPLLDNLDNIRRSFRNPTQHPDKIYDIHETQDLFSLCVDTINRMTREKRFQAP